MKLFIKNVQNELIATIEIDKHATIRQMREIVQKKIGMKVCEQRLLYRGLQLEDEHLIFQLARLDYPRCLAEMTEKQKLSLEAIRKLLKCDMCRAYNCKTEYTLHDFRIDDEKTIVLRQRQIRRNYEEDAGIAISSADGVSKELHNTNDSGGAVQRQTPTHVST